MTASALCLLWTCNACGLKDQELRVPFRDRREDVLRWMERTIGAVTSDHARVAPLCDAGFDPETKKSKIDLKIPSTGADWIGGPPVH